MNSNHKDRMAVTVPDSLAAFPPSMEVRAGGTTQGVDTEQPMNARPAGTVAAKPGIKMIRYRLDVGCKHQINSEELKKVLIEESGVDKNNINNINIQNDYTLVELPDEMPQDIFLHLKSVEIKQHKLDIRRVKARNKKRGKNQGRRGRQRVRLSGDSSPDQVIGG